MVVSTCNIVSNMAHLMQSIHTIDEQHPKPTKSESGPQAQPSQRLAHRPNQVREWQVRERPTEPYTTEDSKATLPM